MEAPAVFNNFGLIGAYITLNGEKYPCEDVVQDCARNDNARLYTMFDNFKKDIYRYNELLGGSPVNFPAFKSLFSILVFDLTKQREIENTKAIDTSYLKQRGGSM